MRPVRLDLEGFASFREPAHLEFADVDYFALVGNTGAGKSTLIDAITFALYGTAPRWEHESSVSNALAPTSNRAVVSLIFDIGGHRYQVAREVRRAPSTGAVTQRNARLERFLDPTACPAPDDPAPATDVLASEVRLVTPAVEKLIGLDFGDFCQCVVLPQGQFANFLKAKPKKRQEILLKLLGAEHYTQIGTAAGARARDARQRIAVHQQQLDSLSGATPQALADATTRHQQVEALVQRLPELLAPVVAAREQVALLTERADAADRAAEVLGQISEPDGLVERGATLGHARDAVRVATETQVLADRALETAAGAAESGPRRHELDRAEQGYLTLERLTTEQADAAGALEDTAAAEERTGAEAETAKQAESRARVAAGDADRAHAAASGRTASTTDLLERLTLITAPTGLAQDAAAADEARVRHHDAAAAATAAAQASEELATAAAALPTDVELDNLTDDLARGRRQLQEWLESVAAAELTAQTSVTTAEAAQTAEAAAERAALDLAALRVAGQAASLRPLLQVGHACPVCDHEVDTLPPPAETSSDLESATSSAADAAARARTARAAADTTALDARADALSSAERARAVDEAAGRLTARAVQLATRASLHVPTASDAAGPGVRLDAAAALLDQVRAARATTDERLAALRETQAAAARRAATEAEAVTQIASALRDAHRSLVLAHATTTQLTGTVDGSAATPAAPSDDATDASQVVAGWRLMTAWVDEQVGHLHAESVPAARAGEEAAARAHRDASAALEAASDVAASAGRKATEAAVAAARARTHADHVADQINEVTRALAGAAPRADLAALQAEADRLAADHETARSAVAAARRALADATRAGSDAAAAVTADRDALTTARDRAAAWSPPSYPSTALDDDLAGCWTDLAAWSAARAGAERAAAEVATAAATEHRAAAAAATLLVVAAFDEHGLDGADVGAQPMRAETVAAVALTEAAAELRAVGDGVRRAADTTARIAQATEEAEVAEQLRTLMRSDQFPEWLAGAALDTLVVGASDSLRQLSDGRFSLIHSGGDFHVVDHFDADSTRSVKTLSGGETFQASLALALALSEQLAALAAGGTSKIESIFLDEGFGTLDPESLDVVAATLENLSRGNRLVGIVTHVAALAERTPVRFRVTNDQQTSRVTQDDTL